MKPRIETLTEKKLIGKRTRMSLSANKTGQLWQSFMPRRKEIQNIIGSELFSIEVYPPTYWDKFDPDAEFEKWAAVEVADWRTIPDNMETMLLSNGRYAVFIHKGPASAALQTYSYIFETWLPDSGFLLDNRPHFALMGDNYKNEDPDSEEEIWIPIKPK
jgi:AraC family transcriptional regulator